MASGQVHGARHGFFHDVLADAFSPAAIESPYARKSQAASIAVNFSSIGFSAGLAMAALLISARDDHHRHRGSRSRPSLDTEHGRAHSGLARRAEIRKVISGAAGGAGNLWCARAAKLGYMVVAPELYARQGNVSKLTNMQDVISKVVSKVPDEQVMSNLDAAVDWAGKTGKGDNGRVGHHWFLLGRGASCAVCCAFTKVEGRRCVVRADRGPGERARSKCRCWDSMAARTRAPRSIRSSRCALRCRATGIPRRL